MPTWPRAIHVWMPAAGNPGGAGRSGGRPTPSATPRSQSARRLAGRGGASLIGFGLRRGETPARVPLDRSSRLPGRDPPQFRQRDRIGPERAYEQADRHGQPEPGSGDRRPKASSGSGGVGRHIRQHHDQESRGEQERDGSRHEHQQVDQDIAEIDRQDRPGIGREHAEPRREVIAVGAEMLDRLGLFVDDQLCAATACARPRSGRRDWAQAGAPRWRCSPRAGSRPRANCRCSRRPRPSRGNRIFAAISGGPAPGSLRARRSRYGSRRQRSPAPRCACRAPAISPPSRRTQHNQQGCAHGRIVSQRYPGQPSPQPWPCAKAPLQHIEIDCPVDPAPDSSPGQARAADV